MWFDSHCHLHLCAAREPAAAVVERARAGGVSAILSLGTDVATSLETLDLARAEGIWAGAGVHPNQAAAWDDAMASELRPLLEDPVVKAVGETGLDFYRAETEEETQVAAFRAHIDLAESFDKALVIHTRASVEKALEVLELHGPPPRFVFHCWSGDVASLHRALDLGAFVSFAGNVTFPSAGDLREAARAVPDDRLLIESDSPFLAPQPKRGRPNEPAFVVLVGAVVAEARGSTARAVAEQSTANALRLLDLDG